MSMHLKQCPNCNGDLISFIDEHNFKVNKCAQCSREFTDNALKNKKNPVNHSVQNDI